MCSLGSFSIEREFFFFLDYFEREFFLFLDYFDLWGEVTR